MKIPIYTLHALILAFREFKKTNPDITCLQLFVEDEYISTLIDRKTTLNNEEATSSELGPEWRVEDERIVPVQVPK